MAKCGRNYPAHEVDYEQSIVAPAAIYMCELYQITGEETYLAEAARQLQVLELFQGDQPDYHLNQVAALGRLLVRKAEASGRHLPPLLEFVIRMGLPGSRTDSSAGSIRPPGGSNAQRRAESFRGGWKRLLRHGISHERQWTAGAFLRSLGQRSGLGPVLCGEVSGGLIFPGKTS